MALTEAQNCELMRKGNQLFNRGQFFEAGKIFNVIGYKTGLIRLGDLFYFDKEMPLVAYGFYRNANHRPMLDKIGEGFVFALKCLLYEPGTGESKTAAAQPKPAAFKKLSADGTRYPYTAGKFTRCGLVCRHAGKHRFQSRACRRDAAETRLIRDCCQPCFTTKPGKFPSGDGRFLSSLLASAASNKAWARK